MTDRHVKAGSVFPCTLYHDGSHVFLIHSIKVIRHGELLTEFGADAAN